VTVDHRRFIALPRSLRALPSRRTLLRRLAGAGLSLSLLPTLEGEAMKKRRRKRKNNRPKLNQFGCVDVGGHCFGNDAHCCSGICEGTGKSSRCVAHHELGCPADDDTCSESVPCGTNGICYRTTGKAGVCARDAFCDCAPCRKDTDCEAQFGPGAACVVCSGDCNGVNGSKGTACVPTAT